MGKGKDQPVQARHALASAISAMILAAALSIPNLPARAQEMLPGGMVRQVSFLCKSPAGIEATGQAIYQAHQTGGDEKAAGEKAAAPFLADGSCVLRAAPEEVVIQRLAKRINEDMGAWEVENPLQETWYILSVPSVEAPQS